MKNHAKPHKNAQKHTKHTQKHKGTHNDDISGPFQPYDRTAKTAVEETRGGAEE